MQLSKRNLTCSEPVAKLGIDPPKNGLMNVICQIVASMVSIVGGYRIE